MNNLKNIYQPYLENSEVTIIYDDTYNLLNNSKFALVTSGTATLEAAFFNVPQVVVYKTSWISYKIAKFFIKVNYISLVNLILNKQIVKELIQNNLNIDTLIKELNKINQEKFYNQIKLEYGNLHTLCKGTNVSKKIKKSMLKTINSN